jgi:dTDP-glucose 4,6-dehydratase
MNLLITGGAGFIGSNLIHRLIHEPGIHRLINLDCLTYAGNPENLTAVASHPAYRFEKVDLRDPAEVERVVGHHDVTHVMHLAAESHVDRSISRPGDFISTNITGTFHLLEACRRYWGKDLAGKRLHYVSTDEVYGSLGPEGLFSETSPCAPNSPYSASKAAGDFMVRAYFHTYGLPVVTTRCSNNFGPFQYPEKLIPVVIQNALHRRPVPVYGDGMHVRDWLHVQDHVEALWLVLRRGRVGETYNIGGHHQSANLRVAEVVCDLVDALQPGLEGKARDLITFVPDRPGHDFRYALDAGKIARELGWRPARSFEAGLRETVQWYLDQQPWVESVLRRQHGR